MKFKLIKYLFFAALLACFTLQAQEVNLKLPELKYKVTSGKIIGWSVVGISSFIWQAKERWEFQGRKYFEIKFDAKETGFWGSKSYARYYDNPNFWNQNLGVFDYYHVSNFVGKYGTIGGAFTIAWSGAKHNKKKVHYLYDILITGAVSVLGARLGDTLLKL